jgi:hypothetical protein
MGARVWKRSTAELPAGAGSESNRRPLACKAKEPEAWLRAKMVVDRAAGVEPA